MTTTISELPIAIHEQFVLFDKLIESKDKTIALLEDKVVLLEDKMELMKGLLDHLEIRYD